MFRTQKSGLKGIIFKRNKKHCCNQDQEQQQLVDWELFAHALDHPLNSAQSAAELELSSRRTQERKAIELMKP
jgi:hypothetical protein